jgi:hypothetical protein
VGSAARVTSLGEGSTSSDSASFLRCRPARMPSSSTAPGSGSLWPEHSVPINRRYLSLDIDSHANWKCVSHCTTTLPVIFGWIEQK